MTLEQMLTNGYFYSTLASVITLVILLVLITQRAQVSPTIRWFQVNICGFIILTSTQLGQFFGQNAAVFDTMQSISAVGLIILTASFFCFAVNYVGKGSWLSHTWLMALIAGTTLALLYLMLHTHLVLPQDPALRVRMPWGYEIHSNAKLFGLFLVWFQLGFIIPMVLLIQMYRRTTNKAKKRQALIIFLGTIIPFVAGLISQGILPVMGIHVVPASVYILALEGTTLTYAILRYGSTSLDPGAITSSIVQTMNSAALALDTQGNIIFANQAAAKFLDALC